MHAELALSVIVFVLRAGERLLALRGAERRILNLTRHDLIRTANSIKKKKNLEIGYML